MADTQDISFEFLDASAVHLFRGPTGAARLAIEGKNRSYLKVTLARAFPMTEPNRYIGFIDGDGNCIGIIESLELLDEGSKLVAEQELEKRYFIPKIVRVIRLNHEFDITYFEVETDRGLRDFTVRGHSENCVEIAPNRYIIEDIDGNRFEIPDIAALDGTSRSLLAKIL